MADSKSPEGVSLDNLSHRHSQSQHHPLIRAFQRPDAVFASPKFAPCFLVVNIVLLALTAQVFQKTVFSTVILDSSTPPPCTSACTTGDARCQDAAGSCLDSGTCYYPPANEGTACAGDGFTCWDGQCLSGSDACYGKLCVQPADDRCVASVPGGGFDGACVNGECQYPLLADNTRCPAARGDWRNVTVLKGWMCQQGACTAPTQHAVADFAYAASIQAGIIGSALALELILTGDFTPDLAALTINAGLIVIGWDGYFYDTGLEANTGLGRSQVAFGFIAGGLAVLFGNWLLHTKSKAPGAKHRVIGHILVAFWLVTFALVSQLLAQTFENFTGGNLDDNANITYYWAYQATIFAASVNIALAHALMRTDSYTSGFAAFAAITGVIALAWASQHEDKEGDQKNENNYTDTAVAWESLAVISGSISIVIGFLFAFTHKPAKSDDDEKQNKAVSRVFSLVIVAVFFTLIGMVSALFTKHFFERREDVYGVDPRVVGGESSIDYQTNNYGNQISPFAWDFSIWSSAVAASFGIELLVHGGGSGGITALALTQAANLVGWAAKHQDVGNVRPHFDELESRTRGWEGVALVSGVVCVLVTLSILRRNGQLSGSSPPVVVHPHPDAARSLNPEDRDLFTTEGAKQGHNEQ